MTGTVERQHVVHPAERWNSPHRFCAQPKGQVVSFDEAAIAAPRTAAPASAVEAPVTIEIPLAVSTAPEPRPAGSGLTERLLAVWHRLQPSTWGLLLLVALNLILIPFAIAKGG